MTTTDSIVNGSGDTVFDGFPRLAPFNGMYLRAGHLVTIEDYARDLSTAGARAGGAGVAYGFTVTVTPGQPTLHVDAGLAVTAGGRLLELVTARDVPLPAAKAAGTSAWVVQAVPGERPDGDPELVYGSLCDDGGDDPGPQRPLLAEGVRIVYTELPVDAKAGSVQGLRSALAAALFALEQGAQSALLRDLASPLWSAGTPAPRAVSWIPRTAPPPPNEPPDPVPLAVLLRVDGQWSVDPWLVRRDRIETPPGREWQWRLRMRPRNVFLAQVLQLQAQLREIADLATAAGSLGDRGFVELPPAGFLPLPAASGGAPDVRGHVAALLGNLVSPTFYACDAAAVGERFWAAQHLDRIPLSPTDKDAKPTPVDVLVPGRWSPNAEGPPSLVPVTRWVAFVRHGRVEEEPAAARADEVVRVYHATLDQDQYNKLSAPPGPAPTPQASELAGDVHYPAGGFEAPDTNVFGAIATTLDGAAEATVLVVAKDRDQLPVTALRAALLVAPFRDLTVHFRFWPAGGEPPRVHVVALLRLLAPA